MGWVEGIKMGTDWYNDRMEKERLARKEAQDKILFDAKMEEMDRAKRERQQLGDAAKPATVVDKPTVVDIGNGQKVYDMANSDSVAGSDARQARMMTERDTGQGAPAPVVQQSQFSMNGTPFADQATMQAAAAAYNGPQAIAQRQAAVLNQNGNPLGAMQLQNTAAEAKLNQFKLSDAETAQANKLFNTHVDEVISKAPDGWTGLAKIATETQVGPMKGVNVRVQSDGKQMRFVATMPDGTERPGNVYENSAEGFARARNDLMKLDPDTKTKILAEQAKTDYTKSNDDRNYDLKKKEAESKIELRSSQAQNDLLKTQIALGKSAAPTGVDPKPIDTYLMKSLGGTDSNGVESPLDPQVLSAVRSAAFSLPQAVNDPQGAAITAHLAWTTSMKKAGGDVNKALAIFTNSQTAPTEKPSAPKTEAKPEVKTPPQRPTMQSTAGPTYTKWLAAKNAKDKVLSNASSMSKQQAEVYLAARLPALEQEIKANENYTQQ